MMRRLLVLACTMALVMTMSVGVAAALPTHATNYWTIEASCDALGTIDIEVVNRGTWGSAKVAGTHLALIPRWFGFTVTDLATDTVVVTESHAKDSHAIDDVCAYSWVEVIPEGDPYIEPGEYLLEAEVGVKVRGR